MTFLEENHLSLLSIYNETVLYTQEAICSNSALSHFFARVWQNIMVRDNLTILTALNSKDAGIKRK